MGRFSNPNERVLRCDIHTDEGDYYHSQYHLAVRGTDPDHHIIYVDGAGDDHDHAEVHHDHDHAEVHHAEVHHEIQQPQPVVHAEHARAQPDPDDEIRHVRIINPAEVPEDIRQAYAQYTSGGDHAVDEAAQGPQNLDEAERGEAGSDEEHEKRILKYWGRGIRPGEENRPWIRRHIFWFLVGCTLLVAGISACGVMLPPHPSDPPETKSSDEQA